MAFPSKEKKKKRKKEKGKRRARKGERDMTDWGERYRGKGGRGKKGKREEWEESEAEGKAGKEGNAVRRGQRMRSEKWWMGSLFLRMRGVTLKGKGVKGRDRLSARRTPGGRNERAGCWNVSCSGCGNAGRSGRSCGASSGPC